MPIQQSLNSTSPEAVANGTEISIVVSGITVGEIYEFDFDTDQGLQEVPTLGSRIVGNRRGLFKGKGQIKGYWLNKALRTIVMGAPGGVVSAAGMTSSIYESASPFFRFNIVVASTNPSAPNCTLINCVVAKDAVKFTEKPTTDDVDFVFEDKLGE